MTSRSVTRAYARLLAWYPPEWRAENGPAMLGTLLDQADAEGRQTVSLSDRFGLALAGLRERAFTPRRPTWPNVVALSAAAALSLFYVTIIWAPGIQHAGVLGPYSNPSIITCGLLVGAFTLTAVSQRRVARLLALGGATAELVVGVLSHSLGWLGPSWPTVILFVGLATLSVWPMRRFRSAVAAVAVLAILVAAAIITHSVINLVADLGPWASAIVVAALAVIGLILIVSGHRIHKLATTVEQDVT